MTLTENVALNLSALGECAGELVALSDGKVVASADLA